jgi:ubiquinone/menaquinone biosynthesis C-methylase UbiE
MSAPDELEAIRERYARRSALPADRYSRSNPEVQARMQERWRAMTVLLSAHGIHGLEGLDLLDIGSGTGSNLLEFLEMGADPRRLVGNDLIGERLEQARRVLPASVRLLEGDASALHLGDACFDVVHQSTVFSSILDDALQSRLAQAMWRWLRPGGGVLWYDFTFDNPFNRDVRGVPLRRVRALFPQARISARRVTLAPPIARGVVRFHPGLYSVFNRLPMLRTHLLCWIEKP